MKLKVQFLLVTLAVLLFSSSCSMMHDDLSECQQELRVSFKYDMNMKFADAFQNEVRRVTLYAYLPDGTLAMQKTESVDDIKTRGGYMTLDKIRPGHYTLAAWAEGEERHPDTYTYGTPSATSPHIDALTCRINRNARQVSYDLTPLFHGLIADADLSMDGYGVKSVTMPLTKDTNTIRVVIQNASGKRLDASDFDFFIDDDNSFLAYDNSPLSDDSITYRPWSQYDGAVDNGSATDNAGTVDNAVAMSREGNVSAVVAETTVNRLFTAKSPRLRVVNTHNGNTVFNIPLIDYILLVKGNYNRSMTDQEYLDRQDEYNFVFFVDDNHNWLSASIYINSWRVVLQDAGM